MPKANVRADVVIPFHGRVDMVLRCLRALAELPPVAGHVFLVDDASPARETRGLCRAVESLCLAAHWVVLPRRAGFVAAVNAAWPLCTEPMAVVLNSDALPCPDLLPKLSVVLERHPHVAAVAPASDNAADLYQYRSAAPRQPALGVATVSAVPYLTAMCLGIRRSVVDGRLFDPVFTPGYFEDLDLSCRLRARGWGLAVLEDCRIHHSGRATFGLDPDLPSILMRNCATFAARWAHMSGHGDLTTRLGLPDTPREHSYGSRHRLPQGFL